MTYIPLKKDLTEGTEICNFCDKPLNSLTAYILKNIENNCIVYAGPTCAKKNISSKYNIKLVPDLTKFTLSAKPNEDSLIRITNNENKTRNSTLTDDDKKYKRAIEYIELRENKLNKNFNTSYQILEEYYKEYLINNKLEKQTIEHILNIEKKAPNELKLDNLQKCYNYSFWISAGIKKLDKDATNFLSSILKYLETNLKISEKQKIGVNKWLKNLDNIPQIK